jgi:hypothetical protein
MTSRTHVAAVAREKGMIRRGLFHERILYRYLARGNKVPKGWVAHYVHIDTCIL